MTKLTRQFATAAATALVSVTLLAAAVGPANAPAAAALAPQTRTVA